MREQSPDFERALNEAEKPLDESGDAFEGIDLPMNLVPIAFLQTRIRVTIDRTVKYANGMKRTRGIDYTVTGEEFYILKQLANELDLESAWNAFSFILTFMEVLPHAERAVMKDSTLKERIQIVRIYIAMDKNDEPSFAQQVDRPFNDGYTWEPTFNPTESSDDDTL